MLDSLGGETQRAISHETWHWSMKRRLYWLENIFLRWESRYGVPKDRRVITACQCPASNDTPHKTERIEARLPPGLPCRSCQSGQKGIFGGVITPHCSFFWVPLMIPGLERSISPDFVHFRYSCLFFWCSLANLWNSCFSNSCFPFLFWKYFFQCLSLIFFQSGHWSKRVYSINHPLLL
jgi:hypothetical protein